MSDRILSYCEKCGSEVPSEHNCVTPTQTLEAAAEKFSESVYGPSKINTISTEYKAFLAGAAHQKALDEKEYNELLAFYRKEQKVNKDALYEINHMSEKCQLRNNTIYEQNLELASLRSKLEIAVSALKYANHRMDFTRTEHPDGFIRSTKLRKVVSDALTTIADGEKTTGILTIESPFEESADD